jgi:hypothetical protein
MSRSQIRQATRASITTQSCSSKVWFSATKAAPGPPVPDARGGRASRRRAFAVWQLRNLGQKPQRLSAPAAHQWRADRARGRGRRSARDASETEQRESGRDIYLRKA